MSLTKISTIPDGIIDIDNTIPDSVVSIGEGAFDGISEVNAPSSIVELVKQSGYTGKINSVSLF